MARTTPFYEEAGTPLISWRAVFAGAVLGLGIMTLLTTLWLAIAFGSNVTTIRDNLAWYLGASGIAALFFGGMLAGWMSGIRGWVVGLFNGLTVWALNLIAAVAAGIPSTLQILQVPTDGQFGVPAAVAWSAFWSLLISMAAAAIGGVLGGAMARPDMYERRREVLEPEMRERR